MRNKPAPIFIFEGPDGVGKTTLAKVVLQVLESDDGASNGVSFSEGLQFDVGL